MAEKRFGLARRPFPATPDETLYYPASGHESALERLQQALADEEGLALLTGAPGAGKTLLAYCLIERLTSQLGSNLASAFLTNSHLPDRAALLQAILYDLGLPYDGNEQTLRLRLTDFLLQNRAAGKCGLVIVDEAHLLSADLLEELRLLGNLEAGGKKAIQVILVAQPAILETLHRPELAALCQRLAVRIMIEPLGLEEAVDYLMHHLRAAGGEPSNIIDEAALEVLARGAKGVPRLLNQAASQALALAEAGQMETVDSEAALEALAMRGMSADEEEASEEDPPIRLPERVPA